MRASHFALLAVLAVWLSTATVAWGQVAEGFETEPDISVPTREEVRERVFQWLGEQKASPELIAEAATLWETERFDMLQAVAETVALVDAPTGKLVLLCATPWQTGPLPELTLFNDEQLPDWVRHNLRLYYGRWLAHQRLYDELLNQVVELEREHIVDPATLLFFQGVAHHRLLNKKEGLKALDELLLDLNEAPSRYLTLARLMKADLAELDEKSLDHISRRMDDVTRRLDLGRAGTKEIEIEDGIIDSLDQIIAKMEEDQQNQGGGGGGSSSGGQSQPSAQAMQDSQAARASGAGETDRKKVSQAGGWGELPPKQREEALQQIGKDFPPHYREAIEQYFRKRAAGSQN